jgi:hypothetical protein
MKRVRRRNHGLRKRCGCPRKVWPKCPHSWHFNYKPRGGKPYRISLDRELRRHIDSKTEAQKEAARIRVEIDGGTFRTPVTPPSTVSSLTYRSFADLWNDKRGKDPVRPRDNKYGIDKLCAFAVPRRNGVTFGEMLLAEITTGDVEA